MKYKDYYQALGVKPTATLDEIKKAYRKLAHQYHPDVSKDPKGEEKFKEVAEAYSTLKDPEKRAAYDELGHYPAGQEFRPPPNWGSQSAGQGFAGGNAQGFSFDDIDLSDLFASFSGDQQQAQRTATAGQDYELSTDISLEDAHAGSTVELNFTVQEQGQPGQGQVKRVPHTFKTRIPKGVTNGQKLLLRGKGGKGFNGGRDGNLYLTINFIPHRLFRVKDHDLLIDLPISPWEAALGATIKVPTLTGAVNLKIPASTSSGQKLRIAKRGLPKKNEEFGDLFAITQIVLPPKLSEQEQALLKQLSEISTFDPRPNFE